jgi:hypothetical protein
MVKYVIVGSLYQNYRYTSSSGERRIRVHTAAAPVVSDLGEMYRQADTGAVVSLLSRIGELYRTTLFLLHSCYYHVSKIILGTRKFFNF